MIIKYRGDELERYIYYLVIQHHLALEDIKKMTIAEFFSIIEYAAFTNAVQNAYM